MFAKAPIDPNRVVLLGFSDGASYALSLGTANPRLFRSIIALSPGYTAVPRRVDPAQRIFIAHGTDDQILPPGNVRKAVLPDLQAAGLKPRMRWFNGGHTIDRAALEEALDYALAQP
jgi:predicted esterase